MRKIHRHPSTASALQAAAIPIRATTAETAAALQQSRVSSARAQLGVRGAISPVESALRPSTVHSGHDLGRDGVDETGTSSCYTRNNLTGEDAVDSLGGHGDDLAMHGTVREVSYLGTGELMALTAPTANKA